MVKEIMSYVTEDGSSFPTRKQAEAYESTYAFRQWCNYNICVGGEWSSKMVVDTILEQWTMMPKHQVHEPRIIKPLPGSEADPDDDIPF